LLYLLSVPETYAQAAAGTYTRNDTGRKSPRHAKAAEPGVQSPLASTGNLSGVSRLTPDDLKFLIAAWHHLAQDQRLSVRRINQVFEDPGLPRSVGSIVAYLAQSCDRSLINIVL